MYINKIHKNYVMYGAIPQQEPDMLREEGIIVIRPWYRQVWDYFSWRECIDNCCKDVCNYV